MDSKDFIADLQNFDPLLNASKISNKSYKDDDATMHLGLGLSLAKNKIL